MHRLTMMFHAAVASVLIAGAAIAAPPASVAIVSDATGDAYVVTASNPVRLTLLSELQSGQVLRLEPGSRVVVAFLPGGDVYELAGAGRFLVGVRGIEPLDTKNPPHKRELPASLQSLAVKASDVSQGAVIMRGGGLSDRVVLVRPSHAIPSQQALVFEWRPMAKPSTVYRFLLLDGDRNKALEADVNEARFTLPPGIVLNEGEPYTWVVSARNERGVTTESAAEFTIVPSAQRMALESARPAATADVTERVVYALALENRGLQEEAQRYWSALAGERGELRSRVVQR